MKSVPVRAKPTNVTLNPTLLEEAKTLGINVSKACEQGLRREISEEKARKWRQDNQEAILESNAYIEKYGLPLGEYRQF